MYEYYKLLKKKISLERYFKAYTEGFILERVKSNRCLNLLFFRDNLVSRYKHIQVSVKSTESLDLNFQWVVLVKVILNAVLPIVQQDTVYMYDIHAMGTMITKWSNSFMSSTIKKFSISIDCLLWPVSSLLFCVLCTPFCSTVLVLSNFDWFWFWWCCYHRLLWVHGLRLSLILRKWERSEELSKVFARDFVTGWRTRKIWKRLVQSIQLNVKSYEILKVLYLREGAARFLSVWALLMGRMQLCLT